MRGGGGTNPNPTKRQTFINHAMEAQVFNPTIKVKRYGNHANASFERGSNPQGSALTPQGNAQPAPTKSTVGSKFSCLTDTHSAPRVGPVAFVHVSTSVHVSANSSRAANKLLCSSCRFRTLNTTILAMRCLPAPL